MIVGGAQNQPATLSRLQFHVPIPLRPVTDVLQVAIPEADFAASLASVGAGRATTEPRVLRNGTSPERAQVLAAGET